MSEKDMKKRGRGAYIEKTATVDEFKTTLAQDLCWVGKTAQRKRGRPSVNSPRNSPVPIPLKRRCLENRPTDAMKFDNFGHSESGTMQKASMQRKIQSEM
ncbi:unnamed protein product [Acanthoscelides obtectus]|uniref:Uncharacterized protein n=1 Tax=Acanthoscelides obtectus TaxID=200917 RepID=A0A9P0KZU1_ACAOB|nr:unnamed protein product [Acanthoscelides obtectus]CAK1619845.1 hypothetical protein AOBTE_LOCUS22 [Acanthoscelides obtectus]